MNKDKVKFLKSFIHEEVFQLLGHPLYPLFPKY